MPATNTRVCSASGTHQRVENTTTSAMKTLISSNLAARTMRRSSGPSQCVSLLRSNRKLRNTSSRNIPPKAEMTG